MRGWKRIFVLFSCAIPVGILVYLEFGREDKTRITKGTLEWYLWKVVLGWLPNCLFLCYLSYRYLTLNLNPQIEYYLEEPVDCYIFLTKPNVKVVERTLDCLSSFTEIRHQIFTIESNISNMQSVSEDFLKDVPGRSIAMNFSENCYPSKKLIARTLHEYCRARRSKGCVRLESRSYFRPGWKIFTTIYSMLEIVEKLVRHGLEDLESKFVIRINGHDVSQVDFGKSKDEVERCYELNNVPFRLLLSLYLFRKDWWKNTLKKKKLVFVSLIFTIWHLLWIIMLAVTAVFSNDILEKILPGLIGLWCTYTTSLGASIAAGNLVANSVFVTSLLHTVLLPAVGVLDLVRVG